MMQSLTNFYKKTLGFIPIYNKQEIKVKIGASKQESTLIKLNPKVDWGF